jgi:serine/threonine-protein kinase
MFVCTNCKREVSTPGSFCPYCGTPAPAQPEQQDPYIGQTINGKYFVNQVVGQGGMGQVYKATHLNLDRPIALKMLNKSFLSDPSIVQRFHREARAASRLNHSNSINVIDFGQTEDGTLFMATEFLSGRSLSKLLAQEYPLPEKRIVKVVGQILAALSEAHALGIVHRDLKPENVMVETRRDEPDFVKVLDFGIAKLNEPGEGSLKLTQAGMVCGTPGYMSPEQARGEELDARSDLYSVGVILYELATGRLPFEADTPMGLVSKHMVEIPVSPRITRPDADISPALEGLIMRALAKEREERPPSAEAMREELLACIDRPIPHPVVAQVRSAATMVLDAIDRPLTPAPVVNVMQPVASRPVTPTNGASAKRPTSPRATAQWEDPRLPPDPEQLDQAPSTRPKTPASGSRPKTTPAGTRAKTPPGVAARQKTPIGTPVRRREEPLDREDGDEDDSDSVETSPPNKGRPPPTRPPEPSILATLATPRNIILASALVIGVVVVIVIWGSSSPGHDTKVKPSPQPPPPPVVEVKPPSLPPPPPPVVEKPQPPPPPAVVEKPQPPPPVVEKPPPPPPVVKADPPQPPKPPLHKPPVKSPTAIREWKSILNSIKIPAASSGEGVLSIIVVPWATVSVNGTSLGDAPVEMRAVAGSYKIKAVYQGASREEWVKVVAGKRSTWSYTFPTK